MSDRPHKLKILCAGAYGIRNAGDDLPLLVLRDRMQSLLPTRELEFRALSRHPDPWEEAEYGVRMLPNLEYPSREAARGRWFRGLNPDEDPAPFMAVEAEIRACDLLVLGAGNALIDLTLGVLRGPVALMSLYAALARRHGRPVMLYGLSVGPLRTAWGRDLTRRLLSSSAAVTVRDAASLALCRELATDQCRVHLLPDATLAARAPACERGAAVLAGLGVDFPDDRPVVALGLRDLARPLGTGAGAAVLAAVREMMTTLRDEAAFLFVPQSVYAEDDDRVLARRLAADMPEGVMFRSVEQRISPHDLIALYGTARATVAVRLHAAVFSALAGTPVTAVNYLPKVAGFMATLADDDRVVEMSALSGEVLATAVRSMLAESDERAAARRTRVAALQTLARGHARIAVTEGLAIPLADV